MGVLRDSKILARVENTWPCDTLISIIASTHCTSADIPTVALMAEAQTRVEDYLDDQIQTAADLDGITALLARVEEQQNLLQKQVCLS